MDPADIGKNRQRTIGSRRGRRAGPTLLCVAAIHGNEYTGVVALDRVFRKLDERGTEVRGELVGVAGNLAALVAEQRYLEHDLNRYWLAENIARVRAADIDSLRREDRELAELLVTLDEIFSRARGEVHMLDLHTSSADGDPFVCIGDTLRNRAFGQRFCVPVVLGLEECIDGSLLEYVNNLGHITMGVEAGRHGADTSIDHHESFVWQALVNAGLLAVQEVPDFEVHRERLRQASHHLHGLMEVRHRHSIDDTHDFLMNEGFVNFEHVEAGQLLARDKHGEIRAAESGRILLPLYQGLGSDGFFIAREVRGFWLKVSTALRRLGLDSVLHWLPGVRRHPQQEATLVIDTGMARWFAVEVFHLLGYRKRRSEDGKLIVSRRKFDHRSPQAT